MKMDQRFFASPRYLRSLKSDLSIAPTADHRTKWSARSIPVKFYSNSSFLPQASSISEAILGVGMGLSGSGGFDLVITGSEFSNNTAGSEYPYNNALGIGLYIHASAPSTISLTNSSVNGNTASMLSSGGGIRLSSSSNGGISSTWDGVTVDGNQASVGSAMNISSSSDLHLDIINSTISNNVSSEYGTTVVGSSGAGSANLVLRNSTISGNFTEGVAGAIMSASEMNNVVLDYVTITNNTAKSYSGGIYAANGDLYIRNSIISGNSGGASPDIFGTVFSSGYNHVGDLSGFTMQGDLTGNTTGPVQLSPLANNGGPTMSHIPDNNEMLRNSIPYGTNDCGKKVASDQRGVDRPKEGACEKGAVEIGSFGSAPFDLDGDGRTDVSIFRPQNGEWWYLRSSDGDNRAFTFGVEDDLLVPGDHTGDGKADVAFFRPSTGMWYVLRSEDLTYYAFPFGAAGDIPVPADYDGDERTDAAVYRPSNGTWYIIRSSDGVVTYEFFGDSNDRPVPADYDGDGKADVAVVKPTGSTGNSEWWIKRSSDGGNAAFIFGTATDRAVQGDYTGDGKADIAYYRPSTGSWYVLRSEDISYYAFPFGVATDLPAPGDYDGDGKYDAAVYRPSTGTWYINRSAEGILITSFGAPTDIPVPSVNVR